MAKYFRQFSVLRKVECCQLVSITTQPGQFCEVLYALQALDAFPGHVHRCHTRNLIIVQLSVLVDVYLFTHDEFPECGVGEVRLVDDNTGRSRQRQQGHCE